MEELIVKIDGKEYKVTIEETDHGTLKIHCGNDVYEVEAKPVARDVEVSHIESKEGENVIKAPLPGTIVDVKIKKGQEVKAGDILIKLVAMKMENEIAAPKDGIVKEVNVKKNDIVNKGDVLVVMG